MQRDSSNFSMQEAAKLVNTPAGQQLLALLQQSDKQNLHEAMEQAKSGNYRQAKEILSPLLSSPEVQHLLQQLGGK